MAKKLLIFDFDGVIADSFNNSVTVLNTLLQENNEKKFTKKEFKALYEGNIYDQIKGLGLSMFKILRYKHVFRKRLAEKQSPPFPDIITVVKQLQKKHDVVIITSNFTKVVKIFCTKNNLKVKTILGADRVKSKVKKIHKMQKKHPNKETYYIGDTTGDIIEGKKAKVKTVAVTWGYHSRAQLAKEKPDILINKPRELLNQLS